MYQLLTYSLFCCCIVMSKQNPNPFEVHRPAILSTAASLYFAEKGGIALAEEDRHVMLPQDLGDGSRQAYREALREQSKVDVAARAVCRMALLRDEIEQRPVIGKIAKLEAFGTSIIDRKYIGNELGQDGLVEQVRGNAPRIK